MAFDSLSAYLETLHAAGDLDRVTAPLRAEDELAAVAEEGRTKGGPAMLFPGDADREISVAANLLATSDRLRRACGGRSPDELAEAIEKHIADNDGGGLLARLAAWATGGDSGPNFAPTVVKTAECQQIVRLRRDVDLALLPLVGLPTFVDASLRFATTAEVYVRDASTGRPRLEHGLVCRDARSEIVDRLRLFLPPHVAPRLPDRDALGGPAGVVLALGGDPAGYVAATCPAPGDVDRVLLTGFLRDAPRAFVSAKSLDLIAPADTDIVIEGHLGPLEHVTSEIDADARHPAWSGTVGAPLAGVPSREIRVTAVTHRANPVVPLAVPGGGVNEQTLIRSAMIRVFTPWLRRSLPELVAMAAPDDARSTLIVAINKQVAGQAAHVARALGSQPIGMYAKTILLVDADVDPADPLQCTAAVREHVDWSTDLHAQRGVADPESPIDTTTRAAIDATRKLPGER